MAIKVAILLLLYLRSVFRVLDDSAYILDGRENKHYMNQSLAVACMIAAAICFIHIVYLLPLMIMLFIEYCAASKNAKQRRAKTA